MEITDATQHAKSVNAVNVSETTCWTLIHSAAQGDRGAREEFANLYEPIARAFFTTRWLTGPLRSSIDDAVQDVFVECFKTGGVLDRMSSPPTDFRPFFVGVVRNIARRQEEKRRQPAALAENLPASDTSLGHAFDRAWARALVQAAGREQTHAARGDERATKRVELLRLRFQEGLPIREIAARWEADAAALHHEYATARAEFQHALLQVIRFHTPNASMEELERLARELLQHL